MFYIISQVVVVTSHAAVLARAPCVKKHLNLIENVPAKIKVQ